MEQQRLDETLGTDPWVPKSEYNPSQWWAQIEQYESNVLEVLDQVLANAGDGIKLADENARLQTVVRSLEQKVYELEAKLTQSKKVSTQAAQRVGQIVEEMKQWKQNAPSA